MTPKDERAFAKYVAALSDDQLRRAYAADQSTRPGHAKLAKFEASKRGLRL